MKKLLQHLSPITWGYKPIGNCPIQSEGYFFGYYFYFRARWNYISIDFAESSDEWWRGNTMYYRILHSTHGEYDAGWYPKDRCTRLIYLGCVYFLIYKLFKIKL